MRAVVTAGHGDRSNLQVVDDYAEPVAAPGEAIIEVAACALNYHDIFTRRGMPGIRIPLPVIAGSDIAGTIVQAGEDAGAWRVGDRVLVDPIYRAGQRAGMIGETADGGRAERVAVPLAQLIPVPDAVGLDDAAVLPLAYGTAHRMLVTRGRVAAGERILVLGASGGVGAACVQLAKIRGLEVVACAGSPAKLARLKEIGADHVIDYSAGSFAQGIRALFGKPGMSGGGGVDVAVNFTGGGTWIETQKCVRRHGRILTCGATAGYEAPFDARYLWTFEHEMTGSNGWDPEDLHALLALIAQGQLKPVIDDVLPLAAAAEAERRLEDREVFGKLLLRP